MILKSFDIQYDLIFKSPLPKLFLFFKSPLFSLFDFKISTYDDFVISEPG